MSIIILVNRPRISVLINYIKAMYNIGGNVGIHFSDYHENTSSVTISNSIIAHGSAAKGGGLFICVEARQPWQRGTVYPNTSLSILEVLNTRFVNNSASDRGGGVLITQYERSVTDNSVTDNIQRNISFKQCQFIGNSIIRDHSLGNGAAVHIYKSKIPNKSVHVNPLFSFLFANCKFKNNQLSSESTEGRVVIFILTNSIIIQDSCFISNKGTAIFLQNSKFSGNIVFEINSAKHGGALSLCQSSKMYISVRNIHIDFINNSATSTGGAINVREQCTERVPLCFFQLGYQKSSTLQFINSVAELAGDVLCGGQIDKCYFFIFKRVMHNSQKVHVQYDFQPDSTEQHLFVHYIIFSIWCLLLQHFRI